MTIRPFWEDDEQTLVMEGTGIGNHAQLLVYNDEINTFEWVIRCLEEILNHSNEQAEQLSIIIHNNGKATVKTAPPSELRPLKQALCDRGLSAVIEMEREEKP